MQFIKVREVKSPVRDVFENAGIDFYIPENTESFVEAFISKNPDFKTDTQSNINWIDTTTGDIHIGSHHDVLIPSGIKSKFDNNVALIANNKSGVATKKKLIIGASVIDHSYQGEWHLHLINTSDYEQVVTCGTKVVQFIPTIISTDPVEVLDVPEDEFFTEKTNRGAGGFGSTGIN